MLSSQKKGEKIQNIIANAYEIMKGMTEKKEHKNLYIIYWVLFKIIKKTCAWI